MTAAEAASLTLAAAAQGPVPESAEIFLSSTGVVSVAPASPIPPVDETARLARLLYQLLRLDEPDAVAPHRRVPGGLLVVLARTMRQIDLPVLTVAAFRAALVRFGARTEPGVLAAVFWRAARMRPPDRSRPTVADALLSPRRRTERRSQGPAPAELRRWLRQTEREVFRLRQSRLAAASAAVIATFVVFVGLLISLDLGDSPATARASTTVVSTGGPASPAVGPETAMPSTPARPVLKKDVPDRAARVSPRPNPRPRERRTVEMVNLPRASWAVVRTP